MMLPEERARVALTAWPVSENADAIECALAAKKLTYAQESIAQQIREAVLDEQNRILALIPPTKCPVVPEGDPDIPAGTIHLLGCFCWLRDEIRGVPNPQ